MNAVQWVNCIVGIFACILLVWFIRKLFQRYSWSLVGPLFWYELLRLGRSRQLPWLRAILVLLLLAGLFITYLRGGEGLNRVDLILGGATLPQSRMDKFAETFLIAFLVVQLIAVVLITPPIAGSAISEEKERRTLDFLRGSMLSHHEIILGKYAARMAAVLSIIVAGLPVLVFSTLFGSVDITMLLSGYMIAIMTTLSMGAQSVLLTLRRDSLREALLTVYTRFGTYTFLGLMCGCIPGVSVLSPFSALFYLFVPTFAQSPGLNWISFINIIAYFLFHAVLTVVYLMRATRELAIAEPPATPPDHDQFDWDRDNKWKHKLDSIRRGTVPPINDEAPHLWKERHFTGRVKVDNKDASGPFLALLGTVFVFIFGMTFFATIMRQIEEGKWVGNAINPMMRFLLTGATILGAVLMGSRTAATFTRERQRETLDGLLLIPDAQRAIVIAKWLSPWYWLWEVLAVLLAMMVLTVILGGVHPLGLINTLVQMVGFFGFATSLGLWLSLRCATVTRATVWFMSIIFLLLVLPIVLGEPIAVFVEATTGSVSSGWAVSCVQKVCAPIAVWESFISWTDVKDGLKSPFWLRIQASGFVVGVLYATIAWVLLKRMIRQFEQYQSA